MNQLNGLVKIQRTGSKRELSAMKTGGRMGVGAWRSGLDWLVEWEKVILSVAGNLGHGRDRRWHWHRVRKLSLKRTRLLHPRNGKYCFFYKSN